MANYATAAELRAKYAELDDTDIYTDAVCNAYLSEAHGYIIARIVGFKGTLEADTDMAALLEEVEKKLAYAYIVNRTHVGVGNERVVAEAAEERTQAMDQLEAALGWATGQSGAVHTEDFTDEPTFDMGEPESWSVDPEGD